MKQTNFYHWTFLLPHSNKVALEAFWIQWCQVRHCIQQFFKNLDISLSPVYSCSSKNPELRSFSVSLHRELTFPSNNEHSVRELAHIWKLDNGSWYFHYSIWLKHCIGYLLLHNKSPTNQWLRTKKKYIYILLSHNYCGSGICEQFRWVVLAQDVSWCCREDIGQRFRKLRAQLGPKDPLSISLTWSLSSLSFSLAVHITLQCIPFRYDLCMVLRQMKDINL